MLLRRCLPGVGPPSPLASMLFRRCRGVGPPSPLASMLFRRCPGGVGSSLTELVSACRSDESVLVGSDGSCMPRMLSASKRWASSLTDTIASVAWNPHAACQFPRHVAERKQDSMTYDRKHLNTAQPTCIIMLRRRTARSFLQRTNIAFIPRLALRFKISESARLNSTQLHPTHSCRRNSSRRNSTPLHSTPLNLNSQLNLDTTSTQLAEST